MKIQCQSCQAKYTIADEKVLGKVVKIRCKKCSSTIVINGNETRPAEEAADTQLFDYAGQNEQWTVNVADGDQRTMTAQEIVTEYRAGVVNDETFCWKDDMADWLPLREIEQLYGLVKLGGRGPAVSLHDEVSVANSAPPPAAPLFGAQAASAESPFAGRTNGNGNANGNGLFGGGAAAAAAADPAPAAARRGGGRGQGADLFGNAAHAGGEEDVMTSAATAGRGGAGGGAGGAATAAVDDKLTGQRNENSVLFSLSALTEGAKKPEPTGRTTATADGSGLIDIRALSQNMGGDDKKDSNARVDDIMNLSGGGAFGAALAAPILAPPPLEMADPAVAAGGQKSNKGLLFGLLGGGAFIAIAIVAAVVLTRPSGTEKASADTTPAGSGSAVAAVTASAAPTTADTTPTAAAVADNTPPPPGVGQANGTAKPAAGGGGTSAKAAVAAGGALPKAETHSEPAPKAAPAQPASLADSMAAAAGKPADAPKSGGGGGGTAPFDRGAASGAIGNVNVQSCKKPDGPTGSGHVKITFAPDGSVSSAVVDGGPFPGTPVGGCIAGKFRAAHVPPFSGGPVSVGKSFTIN